MSSNTMPPTNARMPGMSESRRRLAMLPCSRALSGGAAFRTISRAARANGTLIRNSASQPTRLTNRPPTTGPTAAPEVLAICMRPSGLVEVVSASLASVPTMTTALGYAVAVPSAMSARATQTQTKLGENGASAQVRATSAMPSMNSFRGPNRSASLPISGWPAAEVM
ncbi:hypothetical protein QFZ33_001334 [Arthrobacter globiformis]|nr:hypothetical protein [Arthrobacter globiformis]